MHVRVCLAVRFNSNPNHTREEDGQADCTQPHFTLRFTITITQEHGHIHAASTLPLQDFQRARRTFSACCCCSALCALLYSMYMLGRCVEPGVILTDVSHKPHMYITSHHSILRPPWGSLCFAPL